MPPELRACYVAPYRCVHAAETVQGLCVLRRLARQPYAARRQLLVSLIHSTSPHPSPPTSHVIKGVQSARPFLQYHTADREARRFMELGGAIARPTLVAVAPRCAAGLLRGSQRLVAALASCTTHSAPA